MSAHIKTWQERAELAIDWPCFSGDQAAPYMKQEIADLRAAFAQKEAAAHGDLPPLPEQHKELQAYWKCDDCDGSGNDGIHHYMGEFQPPEVGPCNSCGCSGSVRINAYDDKQMQDYARATLAQPVDVDAPLDVIDSFLSKHLRLWKDEGVPSPSNELQSIQAWLSCLGQHGKDETANRMRARMVLLANAANTLHKAGREAEDAAGIYDQRSRAAIDAQDGEAT